MERLYWENTQIEDLPDEIWVDAFGFDGYYEVSNLGRIKTVGRYVSNGKSERYVKERIRKQVFDSDGRLTCPLSAENQRYPVNIPALVYQSFNRNVCYDTNNMCIMHKNKLKQDNRLINLELTTISISHSVNYKKGLLPHLHDNSQKRVDEYSKLTHKTCVECDITKTIDNYEHGRNVCSCCRKIEKKNRYDAILKKNNKKRKNNKIVIITDTITGEQWKSSNKNKCIISKQQVNKYANTGTKVYPYKNSKHANPLLIEILVLTRQTKNQETRVEL